MKKRVLIFSLAYLPYKGGAEIAVKEITDRISDIEFDLICARWNKNLPKKERIGNVTVHRVGPSKSNPSAQELVSFPFYLTKVLYVPLAFFKARSLDRKHRYDALWAVMSYMGFPAVFFRMFRRKIPLILSLQEGDSIRHVTRRKRIRVFSFFYRKIFRDADVVQAISHYLADFASLMGYGKEVCVIPNAVNIEKFERDVSSRKEADVREELHKKENQTYLVTTSRLVPKNAIDEVIKALPLLPPSVRFVVVGGGPDLLSLQGLTRSLDVETRVLFLGEVPHDEIPAYLKACDIFIRPSRSEGMGNSFIEAMAAGIPVIATSVGGITDFLFDPEKNPNMKPTGLFCGIDDPKDIARQVRRLVDEPELRTELVKNAGVLVRKEYNWDLIARKMKDEVFSKVL